MKSRLFKVTLDVRDHQIYYHLDYKPQIKSVGGYLGVVNRGGSLHGCSFEELVNFGSGVHEVFLDEKLPSTEGGTIQFSDTEEKLQTVHFALFCQKVHCNIAGSPFFEIVMNFCKETADAIIAMLDSEHLKMLHDYAAEIPENIASTEGDRFSFFSSSGSIAKVPLENLEALRGYFRNRPET